MSAAPLLAQFQGTAEAVAHSETGDANLRRRCDATHRVAEGRVQRERTVAEVRRGNNSGGRGSNGGRAEGRQLDQKNFTSAEVDKLSIVEEVTPMGGNEWLAIYEEYKSWVEEHEYTTRDLTRSN